MAAGFGFRGSALGEGAPEDDANLGRSVTLLGHVADLLDGIGSGLLHPGRGGSFVWETPAGDTLSFAVHTTHSVVFWCERR